MHTTGVSYLQHHHHHHHQQQASHPLPSSQAPTPALPAGQPTQQPLSSQVPVSHSNSVVQVYSTMPHMAGPAAAAAAAGAGGAAEIHTLGLPAFHPVQVSSSTSLIPAAVLNISHTIQFQFPCFLLVSFSLGARPVRGGPVVQQQSRLQPREAGQQSKELQPHGQHGGAERLRKGHHTQTAPEQQEDNGRSSR